MVQDAFVYVYRLGTRGERLVGVGIAKDTGVVLEEQDRESGMGLTGMGLTGGRFLKEKWRCA